MNMSIKDKAALGRANTKKQQDKLTRLISIIKEEISKRGKNYNTPGERRRAKKGERNRITSVIKKMYKKPKKGSPHK